MWDLLRVIHPLAYLVPPAAVFVRNTRLADRSHQHAFALSRCNTEQFRRCFLNSTVVAWNGLPFSAFEGSMQHFKWVVNASVGFQWFMFTYLFVFPFSRALCSLSCFSPSDAMVMLCGYRSVIPSVRPLVSSGLLNVNNNNKAFSIFSSSTFILFFENFDPLSNILKPIATISM